MGKGMRSEVFITRHLITTLRTAPYNDFGHWLSKNGGMKSYERTFSPSLKGHQLTDILIHSRRITGGAFALDLMGYGTVLRELKPDAGVAVALCDPRNSRLLAEDRENNIDVIAGNILQGSTWVKISNRLNELEITNNGFNLILFRPLGALHRAGSGNAALVLAQRTWKLLNPQLGYIVAELPLLPRGGATFTQWLTGVNTIPGIDVTSREGSILIRRTSGAPDNLPLLSTAR